MAPSGYKCGTDQVDHQIAQMTFKNGVTASLKMVCSSDAGRRIIFYGTKGEIILEERDDEIKLMPFGEKETVIKINTLSTNPQGHGGGDEILIEELYDMLKCKGSSLTDISASIEAHLMGICAEKSRSLGGAVIKVHE